jgi:hypothetical protein
LQKPAKFSKKPQKIVDFYKTQIYNEKRLFYCVTKTLQIISKNSKIIEIVGFSVAQ